MADAFNENQSLSEVNPDINADPIKLKEVKDTYFYEGSVEYLWECFTQELAFFIRANSKDSLKWEDYKIKAEEVIKKTSPEPYIITNIIDSWHYTRHKDYRTVGYKSRESPIKWAVPMNEIYPNVFNEQMCNRLERNGYPVAYQNSLDANRLIDLQGYILTLSFLLVSRDFSREALVNKINLFREARRGIAVLQIPDIDIFVHNLQLITFPYYKVAQDLAIVASELEIKLFDKLDNAQEVIELWRILTYFDLTALTTSSDVSKIRKPLVELMSKKKYTEVKNALELLEIKNPGLIKPFALKKLRLEPDVLKELIQQEKELSLLNKTQLIEKYNKKVLTSADGNNTIIFFLSPSKYTWNIKVVNRDEDFIITKSTHITVKDLITLVELYSFEVVADAVENKHKG